MAERNSLKGWPAKPDGTRGSSERGSVSEPKAAAGETTTASTPVAFDETPEATPAEASDEEEIGGSPA